MAERVTFTISSGQRYTHRLSCQPGDGEDGDESSGSSGRLGKLEWKAIVLDERIVDLEVKYLLRPAEEGGETTVDWLQKKASGQNFWGTFVPSEHRKMRHESLDRLEAIVFEFDNSYSWFTSKEVELIFLREAEPVSRLPMPLPDSLRPGSPAPRHAGSGFDGLRANRVGSPTAEASANAGDAEPAGPEFMQIFTPPTSPRRGGSGDGHFRVPDLRAVQRLDSSPTREGNESGASAFMMGSADTESCQLLGQLDAWLAAAQKLCPAEQADVEVLSGRIAELRGFCQQKLPEIAVA